MARLFRRALRMGGRTAVACVLATWAGMALAPAASFLAVNAAAAALAFAWLAWRAPQRVGAIAVLAALLCAGAARSAAHQLVIESERALLDDRPVLHRLDGWVVEPPRLASGEPQVVMAIAVADPPLRSGTRMRLRLPPGTRVAWGDRVVALAHLELPPRVRNPGGYDAAAALAARAVAGRGRAHWADAYEAPPLRRWPRVTVDRWRRAIETRLERGLTEETRALVTPLVVGDRSALPPEWHARLHAAGLIHLLALSGLHVTWLAAVTRGLIAAAGGGVRARALGGALCAIFYLGLSGPLPSLARAAFTEWLAAAARLGSRALDPLQALSASALGLLVVAPGWAQDLGFQLSCAATLGLATIGSTLARFDSQAIVPGVGAVGRSARAGLRAFMPLALPTVGAQLTASPVLLARLHAIPWITPLSNVLAVPLVGLLLGAAWIALALELAIPGLGVPFFSACEVLAAAFRAVAEASARAPGTLVAPGHEGGLVWLAACGALLLVVACGRARTLERARLVTAPLFVHAAWLGTFATALAILLCATARPLVPPPDRFWVVNLDVGQGDAVALGFARDWWLVDAGPSSPRYDAGESIVVPFLRWAGVRRLEHLLVTHDDADHAGGARAVLRNLAVDRCLAPPGFVGRSLQESEGAPAQRSSPTGASAAPGPAGAHRNPARHPRFAVVARGAPLARAPLVRVLWPPADTTAVMSGNAGSLVLEVGIGGGRALLLADVDSTVEARLDVAPRPALLKVAHHGSGSSSGNAFLVHLSPEVAVVSCGRNNPFGHPHPGVLSRLASAGARVRRTDRSGALWFELGADGMREIDWRHEFDTPLRAPAGGRTACAAPRLW